LERLRVDRSAWASRLWNSARKRAAIINVPFDLDQGWIEQKLARGTCSVTNMSFVFEPNSPFVPSLDQREPGIGYTKANCQVVVWCYNMAKGDWGHDILVQLAKALVAQSLFNDIALSPNADSAIELPDGQNVSKFNVDHAGLAAPRSLIDADFAG
jgi:hypothetical protein